LIDLGAWLSGAYVIPGGPVGDEPPLGEDDEDG
jgi:endogenous inhibitor of DNA gyrase (YacG/DUF329 family)